MEIWSAAILLFLIMDPLGSLPVFMSIMKSVPLDRRKKVIMRELVIALFITLLFLYAGQPLLLLMNLKQDAVSISGAIILFIIAIRMIFPPASGNIMGDLPGGDPLIVPLATPMIAGPSLLAAVMLLANKDPDRLFDWTLAVGISWFASAFILMHSGKLYALLKERGLYALERLMGMILVMLSVQMLLDGLAHYMTTAN